MRLRLGGGGGGLTGPRPLPRREVIRRVMVSAREVKFTVRLGGGRLVFMGGLTRPTRVVEQVAG